MPHILFVSKYNPADFPFCTPVLITYFNLVFFSAIGYYILFIFSPVVTFPQVPHDAFVRYILCVTRLPGQITLIRLFPMKYISELAIITSIYQKVPMAEVEVS